MDTDLLKTFLEVNTTRHFGRAADNLYLTPAAVSARVRQLEHILGVELFIRNRNNIQLTPEGERLVPHAETMLLAWSHARQDVVMPADQGRRLNVGATYSFWRFAMAEQVPRLYELLPDLSLRAEAHPVDILVRRLEERTLDLALLLEPPALAGFRADKIGQIRLVLVSSDPEASVRTALRDGYVHVDWGDAFDLFFSKRFGDAAVPLLHTNLASIALDYLLSHKAAAWLPQSVLESGEGKGLVQVKGVPAFSRPVHAVYRTGTERRDAIAAFVGRLKPLKI
ncbi:MAG TPA: LysR family transcriptional regulator [Candidatus Kapabacteria bacterium]|nr:LysR family transcriptional regulator [Candidatus Kapabacteria bacterium]